MDLHFPLAQTKKYKRREANKEKEKTSIMKNCLYKENGMKERVTINKEVISTMKMVSKKDSYRLKRMVMRNMMKTNVAVVVVDVALRDVGEF